MIAQFRIVKDQAVRNGFDPDYAKGIPVIFDYGSGAIINRSHHPLLFLPSFIEAALGEYALKVTRYDDGSYSTLAWRVYRAMCLLDWNEKGRQETSGREPLAFLCAVVSALPQPATNPYKKSK